LPPRGSPPFFGGFPRAGGGGFGGGGGVAHRPGRVDSGPWSRVGEIWLNPRWLVRVGDFWRDPAGFEFPFEDLEEPVFEEHSDLIAVESRGRLKWAWRRDSGDSPCELKPLDFLALHPELCLVHKGCYLNMERVREFGAAGTKGWLRLDNGQQVEVLSAKDGRVDDWVARSGGIGGEARGIHADWLKPGERVRQAVAARCLLP
jgi:hypothetical protein